MDLKECIANAFVSFPVDRFLAFLRCDCLNDGELTTVLKGIPDWHGGGFDASHLHNSGLIVESEFRVIQKLLLAARKPISGQVILCFS